MENSTHNQYLSFRVDNEQYALDVSSVREVLEYTEITKVPRMPDFMRGVINIRGKVVPIVDLRLKFDLQQIDPTVDTSIIVVEMINEEDTVVMGLMTDAVDAVLDIQEEELQPAPAIGNTIDVSFIKSMAKVNENFIMVLDLDYLIHREEIEEMQQQAAV